MFGINHQDDSFLELYIMKEPLWALCYLHDWDPMKEGQVHKWEPGKNVFPEIHAIYETYREAAAVRLDMIEPEKYWVVRAHWEQPARLEKVKNKS